MSTVDEIKARLDIVDYIGRFVPLKKAGRYHKANCPFHSENTPSFMVSADRQNWHCFGSCASGGDIFAFAMRYHGWSFSEAVTELAKIAGVELSTPTVKSEYLDKLRGLLTDVAASYQRCLWEYDAAAPVRDYLQSRGLTRETCEQFGLGYAPPAWRAMLDHLKQMGHDERDIVAAGIAQRSDKGKVFDVLRDRLVIPIRDERGRVIAFAGRVMNPDDNPKYLNTAQSPLFDKSRILFGYQRENIRGATAVIVEGYFDAIQAHQAGFTNVVAQMGTALTDAQVKLLSGASRIVLALDGDDAGQKAARRDLEQAIKSGQDVRILTLTDGRDPDDVIRDAPQMWAELVEQAQPVADFVIEMETLSANASLPEREALAKRLLPLLMAAESDIYKKANIQKLASRLKLPERELMALARPAVKDVIVEAQVKSAPRSAVETACLKTLLADDVAFHEVVRTFRQLGLSEVFGPADFTHSDYRHILGVWMEALDQIDLDYNDYLQQHLGDEFELPQGEPLKRSELIRQALRLRLQRIALETDALLALENFEQIRRLNHDRAIILEQLRA